MVSSIPIWHVRGIGKVCFGYVVCCREILRFLPDFFFVMPHPSAISLFDCWSCKGNKDGRKKSRTPLDSNSTFEVHDYSVVDSLPEPLETASLPQTRRLKNIMESTFADYKLEGPSRDSMFSWYARPRLATGRWHNALLSLGYIVPYLLPREKDMSVLVKVVKASEVTFLYGARKPLIIDMNPIYLSVRGLRGNCYY